LKKSHKISLGIDCGGTNLKIALVNRKGRILTWALEPINFKQPPVKVIRNIASHIKTFLKRNAVSKIHGIGMGIAGDVDHLNGVVRFSPNMNWKNVQVTRPLSRELKTSISIENDANCAAWGAYCLDAKKQCENLICLTLGTGIGGGIILNGKLFRGGVGSAGEIGHMSIQYNGRPCKCGNSGCIESTVGALGLIRSAKDGLIKGHAPVLKKMLRERFDGKLDPRVLELAAKAGDPFCRKLWINAGEQLGTVLANLVNILNPDRIVLCGGVSKAGRMLLSPALSSMRRRAFKSALSRVKVTVSHMDERLGVAGAALLSWE